MVGCFIRAPYNFTNVKFRSCASYTKKKKKQKKIKI